MISGVDAAYGAMISNCPNGFDWGKNFARRMKNYTSFPYIWEFVICKGEQSGGIRNASIALLRSICLKNLPATSAMTQAYSPKRGTHWMKIGLTKIAKETKNRKKGRVWVRMQNRKSYEQETKIWCNTFASINKPRMFQSIQENSAC